MPSQTFRAAMYGETTGEVLLMLVTLEHPDLEEPIRLVQNNEDIVSRGHTYRAAGFSLPLPHDDGETLATARLSADNVDLALVEIIRKVQIPADVTVELVLSSNPNQVEAGPWFFRARDASWTAQQIEVELGYEDVLNQQALVYVLDPNTAPGMFR